jgi:hypothetical protein
MDSGKQPPGGAPRWVPWLQQVASLVYLVAGLFLLYENWRRFHRDTVFLVGVMFILYSIYRFILVRRWIRAQEKKPRDPGPY